MSPLALNAAEAAALLKRNTANLVAKVVHDRKTLSRAELAQVSAFLGGAAAGDSAPPAHAKSIVALAAALGCDRRTIHRHLKARGSPGRKPDGRYDVAAWRAYLTAFRATAPADGGPDVEDLKLRRLIAEVAEAELRVERLRGSLVPVESVRALGADLGANIRKVLTLHRLAPDLEGLPVHAIEARLKAAEDEVLTQLHLIPARIGHWQAAAAAEALGQPLPSPS